MLDRSQDGQPWLTDKTYGGMSPESARKSWEASQAAKARHDELPEHLADLDTDENGPPPPAGPEDYGLPDPTNVAAEVTPPAEFIAAAEWPDEPPPPVSWLVHHRIPRGDVSTLDGDGGSGKTMAGAQLCAAVARGAPDWLGTPIEPGPAVFLSAEEPEDEMRRRLYRISKRQNFDLCSVADLHLWFPSDVGTCTLATPAQGGLMQPTPLFRSIETRILEIRPAIVVLDNVAAVYAGNQNDRVMARTFVNLWRGLARASGAAVLLLNHPSLSGLTNATGRGGSMDWRNSVRSALHLKPADEKAEADRGVRVLECAKNNYAPLGPPMRLEWVDGVLAVEGTATPLQRAAQDAQADDKFIELLTLRNRLGRDVGDRPGRNYAPKVFEEMEESGGYSRRVMATAMERLFKAGRIALEPVGPPSANKKRIVVATR